MAACTHAQIEMELAAGDDISAARGPVIYMTTPFASKVRYIAQELYRTCVEPDEGARVKATGSLSPKGTLKHKESKRVFAWSGEIHEHYAKSCSKCPS